MTGAPLSVVIGSYDGDPPEGGQGVYVRGLRAALQAQGVDVRTVSGRGAQAIPYSRILHRAPLDFSLALTRDPSPLLRPQPDVVHLQGGPGGVLLPRRLPVPVVYTAHHTYRQAYGSLAPRRALAPLERRSYRLASAVIAVSASTASAVSAMGVRNVQVIPPGIDAEALGAFGESRRDPRLLLFAGRLEPEKGALDAVAAMRAVIERVPGARGVVVGRGRQEAELRAAAAMTGGRVEVRGAVSDEELRSLYAAAAVVLMPSRYEGLGLVALEAMAAGAAVVAYDVTGLRDAAGLGGVLVAAGDVAAMAREAAALLSDPVRRADLAAAGREAVLRTHSWGACADGVLALYRLLAGPP
ncbi:MAG TPA: glycosyltransferase family 4 protein [Candidatus Dormibacteraeota bacterium]|jgi:glycosyltransferase involved in cell wall biosynthesis|nr:glycosyltransferase family 4 protein [Candidatus Dormibacteraeota bacterium]